MSSKLYVDSIEPKTTGGTVTVTNPTVPFGKILQVVEVVSTSNVTNQGDGTDRTILSGSITPSSTSSKILVQCSGKGIWQHPNTAGGTLYVKLWRGTTSGTLIRSQKTVVYGWANSAEIPLEFGTSKLDSPSTTLSQTYTWSASFTVYNMTFLNETAGQVMHLLEVGV